MSDLNQMLALVVQNFLAAATDKIEALDAGADDYLVKPFGAGAATTAGP